MLAMSASLTDPAVDKWENMGGKGSGEELLIHLKGMLPTEKTPLSLKGLEPAWNGPRVVGGQNKLCI